VTRGIVIVYEAAWHVARVTTIAQKGGPARRGTELRTPGLTGQRGGREWSG
jgi:hypothetical protein